MEKKLKLKSHHDTISKRERQPVKKFAITIQLLNLPGPAGACTINLFTAVIDSTK
jgi:hypothetical protein